MKPVLSALSLVTLGAQAADFTGSAAVGSLIGTGGGFAVACTPAPCLDTYIGSAAAGPVAEVSGSYGDASISFSAGALASARSLTVLHARAALLVSGGAFGGDATQIWFANATSSVSTELTLTPIDPADLGRPVDLLLRYRFQGLLRAVHSGDVGASAQARVQVDDGTQQALTCTPDVADPAFCRLDPIRAIYGTPFSYSAYLITSANLTAQPGPGGYSGDIEVDHSRSLEWVDASVYAPKGAALNGWALRAGQDAAPLFSSPVPEPRTVLMAALGVALVLRRTRRYKM